MALRLSGFGGGFEVDEYNRDAYVQEMRTVFPDGATHVITIDLLPEKEGGEVVHQVVHWTLGESAAKKQAEVLNRWRDQSR